MDTTAHPPLPPRTADAAERLLSRLREFAQGLDDDERALLAALLAPGVAAAYDAEDAGEVVGFDGHDPVRWHPAALPAALATAVRGRDVRIIGLGP